WPQRVPMQVAQLPAAPRDGTVVATWIGHATVLLRTRHGDLLIDPMFSERAGPLGVLGPRRCHPPAFTLEQLPNPTAVLLTHDHYDHCDLPTLASIAAQRPQPL